MYESTTVTVGLDVHARSIRLAAVRADELLEERSLPYGEQAVERAHRHCRRCAAATRRAPPVSVSSAIWSSGGGCAGHSGQGFGGRKPGVPAAGRRASSWRAHRGCLSKAPGSPRRHMRRVVARQRREAARPQGRLPEWFAGSERSVREFAEVTRASSASSSLCPAADPWTGARSPTGVRWSRKW
jgi:hypothetical protein